MAADGRSTADDIITDEAVKLHRIETNRWSQKPAIVGLAGDAGADEVALAWLQCEDVSDETFCWSTLVWDGEKARTVTYKRLAPEVWPGPISIGSGRLPALAAMRAGADARRAVEVAISIDVYSGGRIRTAVL